MKFDENVKTAMAGALKRRGGLLCDNLRNSPEMKASLREGLKHRSKTKSSQLEELVRCGAQRNLRNLGN